jgi:O-acetylserine/cysteine efflux transporter
VSFIMQAALKERSPRRPAGTRLSVRDLAQALLVVAIWASNFPLSHAGLQRVQPFTFATYAFLLSAVPAIMLVRRPPVSWWLLPAFGLTLGIGEFGSLFLAMRASIAPSLASIVLQAQAFFTAILAAFLFRERVSTRTVLSFAVAGLGLVLIGAEAGSSATLRGIALVLFAALAWAACNMIVLKADTSQHLGFVSWSSIFAALGLAFVALLLEGPAAVLAPIVRPSAGLIFTLLWQALANQLICYAIWNELLGRHGSSSVAPMGLLVPIFAIALCWLLLREPVPAWEAGACALVVAGLAIGQAEVRPRWLRLAKPQSRAPGGTAPARARHPETEGGDLSGSAISRREIEKEGL